MPAPPIVQAVYNEHLYHYGEPAHCISYRDEPVPGGYPPRMDLLIWDPDDTCPMTTLSTIGMSAVPMTGVAHRAELHFSLRLRLTEEERHTAARFLANLAMYPFQTGEPLDWWHNIANPGRVPFFQTATCVFLHPAFVKDGWSSMTAEGCEVHILNVIPITPAERELRRITAIIEALDGVDIFTPR